MATNRIEPLIEEDQGYRRGLTDRQLNSVRAIVYLVLLAIAVVFGLIKLWQTPIATQDFKFTDFVVAGLALFSIWLSVSFLDRATQQNDRFYDGAYASLREMAASLSQLQERIGERDSEIEKLREDLQLLQRRVGVEGWAESAATRRQNDEHVTRS